MLPGGETLSGVAPPGVNESCTRYALPSEATPLGTGPRAPGSRGVILTCKAVAPAGTAIEPATRLRRSCESSLATPDCGNWPPVRWMTVVLARGLMLVGANAGGGFTHWYAGAPPMPSYSGRTWWVVTPRVTATV